jgi:WD40 repeat protein
VVQVINKVFNVSDSIKERERPKSSASERRPSKRFKPTPPPTEFDEYVLQDIFSLLNDSRDLANCELACKKWRRVINDFSMWKVLLERAYIYTPQSSPSLHWKRLCFQTEKSQCLSTVETPRKLSEWVWCATQLHDGTVFTGFTDYNRVGAIWDVSSPDGEPCLTMLETVGHCDGTSFTLQLSDGKILTDSDYRLRVIDLSKPHRQQVVTTLKHGRRMVRNGAIQLHDGRILEWQWGQYLDMWDLSRPDGQQHVERLQTPDGVHFGVQYVIQLHDGRLFSASLGGRLQVWDFSESGELQLVTELEGHEGSAWCGIQLCDGRILTGSKKGVIQLWDLSKPDREQCLSTVREHSDRVYTLTQLHDGRVLSASEDSTLKVWDLSTPEQLRCTETLEGHNKHVYCGIQLNDGRILSGSRDGTVKVWLLRKPEVS